MCVCCLHAESAGDANGLAVAARGLGVLAADAQVPVVAQTTMETDLFHALEVLTELGSDLVGNKVLHVALQSVLLSVKEPHGDVELGRVGDDGLDSLNLLLRELAGALVQVDVGLLADHVGEASAHTSDLGESEHHFVAAIHVRSEDTKNVLELLFRDNESL